VRERCGGFRRLRIDFDAAKKNVKTYSSLRILGRGTAVEREATRARDGEG